MDIVYAIHLVEVALDAEVATKRISRSTGDGEGYSRDCSDTTHSDPTSSPKDCCACVNRALKVIPRLALPFLVVVLSPCVFYRSVVRFDGLDVGEHSFLCMRKSAPDIRLLLP